MKSAKRIFLLTLIVSTTFLLNVKPVRAIGKIYIQSNGTIDPTMASIQRNGNLNVLTGNISGSIVIERNNIVVDGAGLVLEGDHTGNGVEISASIRNVTIKNMKIEHFNYGIFIGEYSSYNSIIDNTIRSNDYDGIMLDSSSNHNTITNNAITNNTDSGIDLHTSSDNYIYNNTLANNNDCGIESYSS